MASVGSRRRSALDGRRLDDGSLRTSARILGPVRHQDTVIEPAYSRDGANSPRRSCAGALAAGDRRPRRFDRHVDFREDGSGKSGDARRGVRLSFPRNGLSCSAWTWPIACSMSSSASWQLIGSSRSELGPKLSRFNLARWCASFCSTYRDRDSRRQAGVPISRGGFGTIARKAARSASMSPAHCSKPFPYKG